MFSIIALIIFNVSSLHLLRKGRLKLIFVTIWFQEWSSQSYGRLPLSLLHQPFGTDTCAIAIHCIILLISYYIKSYDIKAF